MNNRKYKILLVEDETVIREDLQKKLGSDDSFNVSYIAANGKSALELLKKHSPHVLITDIQMSVMDGIELIRMARKLMPKLFIVVISGYDNFSYAQSALKYGVLDYLLKPVSQQSITALLDVLKKKLDERIENANQELIKKLLSGIPLKAQAQGTLTEMDFVLFLINAGNLQTQYIDCIRQEEYYALLNSTDFNSIYKSVLSDDISVFISDVTTANQMLILIDTHEKKNLSREKINALFSALKKRLEPIPITLCTHTNVISERKIHDYFSYLLRMAEKNLVLGESSLFFLGDTAEAAAAADQSLIGMRFTRLLQSGEASKFALEFNLYFSELNNRGRTQRQIEDDLLAILHFISMDISDFSTLDYESTKELILETCAYETDLNVLLSKTSDIFVNLFVKESQDSKCKDIIDPVLEYISANYRSQMSISELADKFSFNNSYFIRLFKKKTGMTPAQYLINLRITEAKQLLKDQSGLSIKQIAELCSYEDPHYFSRVFKQCEGLTPSEFRSS